MRHGTIPSVLKL